MAVLKEALLEQCQLFVDERLKKLQKTIHDIQESLLSETKSSAGDKHETGRAMLQLEREKTGKQLAEVQKLNEMLNKIDLTITGEHIRLGSIVYTSQANYFIAISTGLLSVSNEQFFAIAPNTPIGKLLLGKKVNDDIFFNGKQIKITSIH
ncbi:3-oxoacyl-ACP synthase [Flavobacteriaceae bacterium R38]|nr:3-oxoacyl-ACP synthase [Flavobacteriaceae bacterium R38]